MGNSATTTKKYPFAPCVHIRVCVDIVEKIMNIARGIQNPRQQQQKSLQLSFFLLTSFFITAE